MSIHSVRVKHLEEAEAAAKKYGIAQLYMHLSALSPSTRKGHASRHGKLFTYKEMREWLLSSNDDVACKCSFAAVLMDGRGQPLAPAIIERARITYEKMATKGYAWTK